MNNFMNILCITSSVLITSHVIQTAQESQQHQSYISCTIQHPMQYSKSLNHNPIKFFLNTLEQLLSKNKQCPDLQIKSSNLPNYKLVQLLLDPDKKNICMILELRTTGQNTKAMEQASIFNFFNSHKNPSDLDITEITASNLSALIARYASLHENFDQNLFAAICHGTTTGTIDYAFETITMNKITPTKHSSDCCSATKTPTNSGVS